MKSIQERLDIRLMLFAQKTWAKILESSNRFRFDHTLLKVFIFVRLPPYCWSLGIKSGIRFWKHALWGTGEIDITIPGYEFPLTIRGQTSDSIVFDSIFIAHSYKKIALLQDPKWILDAGAYVGYSAVYFANQYPAAKIVCLEPQAENFKVLKMNTRNYENIIPREEALWSHSGLLEITLSHNQTEQDNWGYEVRESEDKTKASIPSVSLAELSVTYDVKSWDLLKVDIEGAEREVCNHEFSTYYESSQMMFIELHEHLFEGSSDNVLEIFNKTPSVVQVAGENLVACPLEGKNAS